MFPIIPSTDRKALDNLLSARALALSQAEKTARRILNAVRREGDRALVRLTRQLDGIDLRREGFTVTREEIQAARQQAPRGFTLALGRAARNIRTVALRQLPQSWRIVNAPGVTLAQITRPIERVACYIPGGRFPLPSTVLMSVIPAQVAGVREIVLTSPGPAPAVMVAANILGVRRIFRLGGAQALAAFAYGTKSVPRVDKIVGPGNRYVAAAKKLLSGECGVDFIAGPTELVVAARHGNPRWIAADLVAQSEHGPDALSILITPSRKLAFQVRTAARQMLGQFRGEARESWLAGRGAIVVTRNLAEAVQLINRLAPEHLLLTGGAEEALGQIESAGSIFLGPWSAVAAGDYASGTNHILPTSGAARTRGGLSAADFLKTVSVQRLGRAGLAGLRKTIVQLARTEGMNAHAYSVETRFAHAPTP
jgi:histidinol dehydrogenase